MQSWIFFLLIKTNSFQKRAKGRMSYRKNIEKLKFECYYSHQFDEFSTKFFFLLYRSWGSYDKQSAPAQMWILCVALIVIPSSRDLHIMNLNTPIWQIFNKVLLTLGPTTWVPYDEQVAIRLEEEYASGVATGQWKREIRSIPFDFLMSNDRAIFCRKDYIMKFCLVCTFSSSLKRRFIMVLIRPKRGFKAF